MEQEKSYKFKLFLPPKLNNAQVSAVKPQTHTRDGEFYQNFNKGIEDDYSLPFGMNTSKYIDLTKPVSQNMKLVPEIDQENMDTVTELYSRLYKEAEKIKRWKVTVEYEVKEKERKLQENRKIIEALRKAIQELQFENERLSLKLEDEIHEHRDLLKESNTTRHFCDLLKERFMQSVEKSNKYEQEREETRQMYVDLNNNIERMIQAFEELRAQAENSRLEMYFKLKEEAENMAQLEKEHRREMIAMEKQVSLLTMQSGEKDDKMKHININLQESREQIAELEEVRKQQDEMLKEAQINKQSLLTELEETKNSLQKAEDAFRTLETELQTAVKTLIQVTEQKEVTIEELKQTKILHASDIDELQSKVLNLNELLEKEQKRQKELKDGSDILVLELQKKANELEVVVNLKNIKEKQVEEMATALESSNEVQKDLKHELESTQSKLNLLMKEMESRNSRDSTVQREVHDLEVQLSGALENNENCLQQLTSMKAELEKERSKNRELDMNTNKLLLNSENITSEKNNLLNEFKKLREDLKNQKKMEEKAEKQIENLKKMNANLSSELECVKEEMKQKNEEAKYKLHETGENIRTIENELSKKEKQLKTSDSKINSLKKQIETKVKIVEELHQEIKVLRKKIGTESKQTSITEEKVKKLQLELENINKLHKETIFSYKNEIEMARATEEKLLKELEAMKLVADEAVTMQKEIDIRCQHKIAEMVALMEKHKHQYDKTVEEKDTELEYFKTKEKELSSAIELLQTELSCKKNELSSLQDQLKIEIEEKKAQTSTLETPKHSLNSQPLHAPQNSISTNVNKLEYTQKPSWTPAKIYTVKTPPKSKLQRENTNQCPENRRKKKRRVLLEMDTRSDSSENDILSLVSKEDKFKQLYKDYPSESHVRTPNTMTPEKVQTPSSLKTPGSLVKLAAIKKMRESGWSAISKMDRKNKMKEAEKLFS
ncbi:synaptonemal complex protein 1 isoform X2 [Anolis carolinensis]|uniref:synaptonemal complex protein 1 isoform X2 n=1 Tax=Anolis carolinensis TaxID=28377 RepID=UPI002F2B2EE3